MNKKMAIIIVLLASNIILCQNKKPDKSVESIDNIFIDVKIKGKTYKFLFDTGAVTSIFFDIDDEIVVDKDKIFKVEDGNKDVDTMYFPKKEISLILSDFNIRGKGFGALIISKKIPLEFEENNIRGILGNNFISKHDWSYDWKSNILELCQDKSQIESKEFYSFTFDKDNYVDCVLKTDKNCILSDKYLLDTGYSEILIHSKTNCYDNYINYVSKLITAAKNDISKETIIKTDLIIGDFKVASLPTNIWNVDNSKNLIGIKFLKTFEKVYFLFSENRILLKKCNDHTFSFTTPQVYDNKIYGFLEKSTNDKSIPFKKWVIGSEVNLKENEFEKIEYKVKITEKL